jgi:hypothetical protein
VDFVLCKVNDEGVDTIAKVSRRREGRELM